MKLHQKTFLMMCVCIISLNIANTAAFTISFQEINMEQSSTGTWNEPEINFHFSNLDRPVAFGVVSEIDLGGFILASDESFANLLVDEQVDSEVGKSFFTITTSHSETYLGMGIGSSAASNYNLFSYDYNVQYPSVVSELDSYYVDNEEQIAYPQKKIVGEIYEIDKPIGAFLQLTLTANHKYMIKYMQEGNALSDIYCDMYIFRAEGGDVPYGAGLSNTNAIAKYSPTTFVGTEDFVPTESGNYYVILLNRELGQTDFLDLDTCIIRDITENVWDSCPDSVCDQSTIDGFPLVYSILMIGIGSLFLMKRFSRS